MNFVSMSIIYHQEKTNTCLSIIKPQLSHCIYRSKKEAGLFRDELDFQINGALDQDKGEDD